MSNHLSNEFILSTTPIALHDGINLVPQQLVRGQVNSPVTDGTIWPGVNNNNDNANREINFDLMQVNGDPQLLQQQQVSYSTDNLSQIQAQNMSQAAQIVLLPTQNINLVPNDVGYQLLTSIPNVGVLVPTNLLLTNGYILLPNSANSCQTLPIESVTSTQAANETGVNTSHLIATNVEFETVPQQQQVAQIEQECEFIALADTSTQTVLSGIAETTELNSQTAHLISNNGQIVGIIGSDQLSILQADSGGENQVLLAACIDPNQSGGLNLTSQVESGNSYDINSMLASTISTLAVEKTDQNQAKQWLKDSYIVNRALKALKKTNASSHHHHSRPHPQVIRRRD